MGQSLSLYKVSRQDFENVIADKTNVPKLPSLSYDSTFIDKSFQGLEYVMKKCVTEDKYQLISELFYPNNSISDRDYDLDENEIDNLSEEEYNNYFSWLEKGFFLYLTPLKVKELDSLLATINTIAFSDNFNADEMNEQNIYPWNWNNDTAEDSAFNKRHLTEDFVTVKDFFEKAVLEDCYIISSVG